MGKMHCLDVGCGDTTVITSDSATFLVDCYHIENYSSYLPSNKHIRGLFITHQHRDHFEGLNYLRDQQYTIDFLIYSPYDRRCNDNSVTVEEWNEFNDLKDSFVRKGTETRLPYRQKDFDNPYWDTNGIQFYIIGPHPSISNSDTREIHDASLVITAMIGKRKCLFTGDASDANLEYIAENTKDFCDDILHASHHGSLNGASLEFIKESNAQYTLISTKSGVYENVPHPTALSRYKNYTAKNVIRTDQDGSWSWFF